MEEVYIVLRVMFNATTGLFELQNPYGIDEPPIFDTRAEAIEWIKTEGIKEAFYKIEKYFKSIQT